MSLNLDPPPGFRGFDPHVPVSIRMRRLPHWRQAGATYFVTFHLADALPAAKQQELMSMRRELVLRRERDASDPRLMTLEREIYRATETCIDRAYGRCWLNRTEYAAEVRRSILHYHEVRYDVGCFVVMANHCHLVLRPFEGYELSREVGAIKGVTAKFISSREGLTGAFWQEEAYDRIIRDAEHLYRVVRYVGDNPRKAGISEDRWVRWMNPQWQAVGWDFSPP